MIGAFDSAMASSIDTLRRVRHVDHHSPAVHLRDAPHGRAGLRPSFGASSVASPVFESDSWLWPLCASDM